MKMVNKIFPGLVVTVALFGAIPAAQAVSTTYNYTITGDVLSGDEGLPNDYGLTAGENITATGTFTADLGTIGNETGTVSFATGSGNTMSIDLNGTFLYAADDDGYGTGSGPSLTFAAGALYDFYYNKTSSSPVFYSSFLIFDDTVGMVGQWTNLNLTVVPVPAAVWLFGSGLLGLAGLARRKKNK